MEQCRGSLLYALSMYDFLALVPINPRAARNEAWRTLVEAAGVEPVICAVVSVTY
jgi:hypothetical protein